MSRTRSASASLTVIFHRPPPRYNEGTLIEAMQSPTSRGTPTVPQTNGAPALVGGGTPWSRLSADTYLPCAGEALPSCASRAGSSSAFGVAAGLAVEQPPLRIPHIILKLAASTRTEAVFRAFRLCCCDVRSRNSPPTPPPNSMSVLPHPGDMSSGGFDANPAVRAWPCDT